MASTYSALKIELIGTGDQTGTWGATTNVNLGDSALGEAITGSADVAFSSADVTITLVDTNATQSARNLRLNLTGTSGGARNLILGSGCQIEKLYLINNGLADAVTVKNTTGTGIAVPAGTSMFVYNNGTNVVVATTAVTTLTNSALTSGRVTYAGTAGLLQDSANLTFNGTTLTANTIGAYTLGGTIAGGGNQINNVIIGTSTPLAGSFTSVNATSITNSALTSGRVTYAGASGLLTDSANLLYSGTDLTVYGLTVGRGAGAVSTNTAVGVSALAANTSGLANAGLGNSALFNNTSGQQDTAVGHQANYSNTTGNYNVSVGTNALFSNTTGSSNTGLGTQALNANTTASNNTAVGFQAGYSNTTGSPITAFGYQAAYAGTTADWSTAFGYQALKNTTGTQNSAFGRALVTNTSGASNSAFGMNSLYYNTTGSYNTAYGQESLLSNTTASNNTAVGYQAGYSNTTGDQNVAIGKSALYTNTTGIQHTAVGTSALYANTTGNYNNAFGESALTSNTTGEENVAFGNSTLRANTTASNNSALGSQTLRANTTGANNTAVGAQALRSNTTASNNTAVGYQAGYSNTTGESNTILGFQAGYAVTSSYNVLIGLQSGYSTTGTRNTFVGYASGGSMTSGSKNTIIGAYNGNQGGLDIRTASNYIVLSDGDGNPRQVINGSGYVGINETNPQTLLHMTNGTLRIDGTSPQAIYIRGAATIKPYISMNDFGTRQWDIGAGTYSAGSFSIQSNNVNGVYLDGTATAWASASDERLKDIIEPIEDALTKVNGLRSVIGKYKTDKEGVRRSFLIAQDVQEILPEAVDSSSPDKLGVRYTDVIPLLVAAIKELKAEFDAYKATHP